MTQRFYSYAIFFTGLCILTGLFRSIVYFQLGTRVYELQSFACWFVFEFLIWLIWALILLKYYHHKQYLLTFWVMTVYIAAYLFQFVFYNTVVTREITIYFIIATLAALGTDILYGISLIFPEAGKRPWLKTAGISLFFLGLFLMSSSIWAFSSISVRLNGMWEKVEQWTVLIGSLVPALFLLNFLGERSAVEAVEIKYSSRQESLSTFLGLVALIASVSMLIFGQRLARESLWVSNNYNFVGEGLKKLAEPFEARNYVNDQFDTLRYRLMIPLNYDSTKKYPLVVCLHGASGRGTDNVKQVAASLPVRLLTKDANRIKYPAFLFVPQCPPYTAWGGIRNVASVDSLVFETINALEEEFAIDARRRYVTGNSLGGYGTWHLICTRPEMFAAAIPISGGGNPGLALNIVDTPVWAFHGAEDRTVPVSGSQDIIETIKNAGGDPRYTEYPDEGHHIWKKVASTPGLLDWLFAQERD